MKTLQHSILWSVTALILFALLITALIQVPASASTAFVTTWKTDNKGSSASNQITIPTNSAETYNYFVDWGDGNTDAGVTGNITHTYAQPGTYTVSISGEFPRIQFANAGDRRKIMSVENWGNISWSSMEAAFYGASNLVINASDTPDLSRVSNVSNMFRNARSVYGGLENWNVGNIEVFARMFSGANNFNSDISGWNMSSARNTEYMFFEATSFNQNVSGWNMSQNGIFRGMFSGAISFNQSVDAWPLDTAFNVEQMFKNASSFDYSFGSWDIGSLQFITEILSGASLSTAQYDAMLTAWSQNVTQQGLVLDAGNSGYCTSIDARNYLINVLGWTIYDGGADTVFCGAVDVDFAAPALVPEDATVGTLVGDLVVSSSLGGNFSVSLDCEVPAYDAQFFTLSGNQIFTDSLFDYENPIDQNGDSTYELCVLITNDTNQSTEKFVSIAVSDVDDEPEENDEASGGQTLGTNTGDSGGEVLADSTDESSNTGQVLAATGVAVGLVGVYVGLAVAGVTTVGFRKAKGLPTKDIEI